MKVRASEKRSPECKIVQKRDIVRKKRTRKTRIIMARIAG
jgi:ribosomal protein L36